jgi:hypothetical protein
MKEIIGKVMSYCRWSSGENLKYPEYANSAIRRCDVYCYESIEGGYRIDMLYNVEGKYRFLEKTLQEFKDRLLWLRERGVVFPNSVIDSIDEEIAYLNKEGV